MKTKHLKLYLSNGKPIEAIEAIQSRILSDTQKSLDTITDPETLLAKRKVLREQKEQLQAKIKQQKIAITKSNKQRESMLGQWASFVIGVTELARKNGIDFEQFPAHLASGRTFIQKLQNIDPESFVMVEGLRIPQKKTDALLDDDQMKLFEVEATQVQLEEIIQRKAKAMKALFDNDSE